MTQDNADAFLRQLSDERAAMANKANHDAIQYERNAEMMRNEARQFQSAVNEEHARSQTKMVTEVRAHEMTRREAEHKVQADRIEIIAAHGAHVTREAEYRAEIHSLNNKLLEAQEIALATSAMANSENQQSSIKSQE